MIRMLHKKYFQPIVYSMSTRPFEERVPGEEAFMILGAARCQLAVPHASKKKFARDFDTLLAVSKTTN